MARRLLGSGWGTDDRTEGPPKLPAAMRSMSTPPAARCFVIGEAERDELVRLRQASLARIQEKAIEVTAQVLRGIRSFILQSLSDVMPLYLVTTHPVLMSHQ